MTEEVDIPGGEDPGISKYDSEIGKARTLDCSLVKTGGIEDDGTGVLDVSLDEKFGDKNSPVTEQQQNPSNNVANAVTEPNNNNVAESGPVEKVTPTIALKSPAPDEHAVSPQQSSTQEFGLKDDKVMLVAPYEGELCPPGFLHGAFRFAVMVSTNNQSNLGSALINPVNQVMNALAPKLDDLKALRRFTLKNFDEEFVHQLGRGYFGEVYRQTFKRSIEVALKRFMDSSNPLPIYKEVHTLIALQHKRVVKLYGAFHERGTFLVMELCMGNLRYFMKELTKRQKVRFGIQMMEGLAYMHSKEIIHCDLKPDNVLITSTNNAVIGGFGNSHVIPTGYDFIRIGSSEPFFGSPGYSDALANVRVYSKSSDIFTAGCTLYEIDCEQPLMEYPGRQDVSVKEYIRVIKKGRLIEFPALIPGAPTDVLEGKRETLLIRSRQSAIFGKMLPEMVQNARYRLGASELLQIYHGELTTNLHDESCSWALLDKDTDLGQVSLQRKIVKEPMVPNQCTYEVNVAMDPIYWDSKINLAEFDVTEEQEFLVVKTDEIETLINKLHFIHERSFRVSLPAGVSLAPLKVASSLEGPVTLDLPTATIRKAEVIASEPVRGSKKSEVKAAPKPSCSTTSARNNKTANVTVVKHLVEEALVHEGAIKPLSQYEKSSARKRSRQKHQDSSQDKPSVMEPTDEIKKKHKKNLKRIELVDLTGERSENEAEIAMEHLVKVDTKKCKDASQSAKEVKDKEWYVRNKQRVPSRLRGKAPDPVNLPLNFTPGTQWNGWFECGTGCPYYTHDYEGCRVHISSCSDRQSKKL